MKMMFGAVEFVAAYDCFAAARLMIAAIRRNIRRRRKLERFIAKQCNRSIASVETAHERSSLVAFAG
jgi:hypothetical protein